MVVPRANKDRTYGVHNDDSVVALRRHVRDQVVTVVPESQVVAVTLIAIDSDVTLTGVGIGKDETDTVDLGSTTGKSSLLSVGVVISDALDVATLAADLGLDRLERSDEVWEVGGTRA